MSEYVGAAFRRPTFALIEQLLARRSAPDHWEGHLASSALSTATAILALHLVRRGRLQVAQDHDLARCVSAGASWLVAHQNADGGWGDTIRSRSNISTTAIVWASLSSVGRDREVSSVGRDREASSVGRDREASSVGRDREASSVGRDREASSVGRDREAAPARSYAGRDGAAAPAATAVERARAWLDDACGGSSPDALRAAILTRYGKDRTFSVPILTLLTLADELGDGNTAWRAVPQLPFELAALPHSWFQHLSLPVVSYALPALIAIGQVRHHHAPTRNPLARFVRDRVRRRTLRVLLDMQPASGGYLEATPLTSFVVMSLAGMGDVEDARPVAAAGVRFLTESMRDDGSWPIDTNLSTWVTTLSIGALGTADALPTEDVDAMRSWLLAQQTTREHPFTHAAAGGWAWTPLSGGVPDADDTSGALVALAHLGVDDERSRAAAARGVRWLIDLQNRNGGIPTFCRGWGTLPFDQSTPEITAHALQAWSAWAAHLDAELRTAVERSAARALTFIAASQRRDGSWIPLWFGNEHAGDQHNPVYGTARVLLGLQAALVAENGIAGRCRRAAIEYLVAAQNQDGGWGGTHGAPSTIEETGLAVAALSAAADEDVTGVGDAVARGAGWISSAVTGPLEAAPIGLYFAQLWYFEELYPIVFALDGLVAAVKTQIPEPHAAVTSPPA